MTNRTETDERRRTRRPRSVALPYLYDWRMSIPWTQLELSRAAGVTPVSVSYYETGKKRASLASAKRLADALGVTINTLRYERPSVPQVSTDNGND